MFIRRLAVVAFLALILSLDIAPVWALDNAEARARQSPRGGALTISAALPAGEPADSNWDSPLWLGLVGSVTGILSLTLAYLGHRRANRAEVRLQAAEDRAQELDDVRMQTAVLLKACEKASALAVEVDDQSHPEWRALSTGLKIGRYSGPGFAVIFVEAPYQTRPTVQGQRTHSFSWRKWYLGISDPDEPVDTYAVFGELPNLLKRPGELSFAIDEGVEGWARDELDARLTVAIMYVQHMTD